MGGRPGRAARGPDRAAAILIDTSAWVEYLRATGSEIHREKRELLRHPADAAVTDVVVAEVLSGGRDEAHARDLMRMLDRCRLHPTRPLFGIEHASAIFRTCRRGGFTPRSLTDCLIAAVAIDRGLELLHADRDFDRMAEHVGLAVWR